MPVSGPKLGGARSGDSAGSGLGARNRGTPGFPVPPEMQSREIETEPADVDQDDIKEAMDVVEDIIVKMVVPDETVKQVPMGIVDPGNPLDLVTKAVVDGLVQAQDTHKGTFFALKIPDALAHKLAVPGGEPPEKLHVTLVYAKGLDPLKRKAVAALAREWSAKAIPLDIKIGGIGRFSASDSSDGKDVIYLSVDSPGLSLMRQSLVSQLHDIGVDPDTEHGWTPHITLKYVDPSEPFPVQRIDPVHTQIFDTIIKEALKKEDSSSEISGPPADASTPRVTKRPEVAQQILAQAAPKLLKHGVDVQGAKIVGRGSRGTAFELKDGRVLKISDDKREASAMFKLKGRGLHHIVHVFDAWKFGDNFLVLQEKLTPIPASAEQVFNKAIDECHVRTIMGKDSFDWKELERRIREVHGILQKRREEKGVGPGALSTADDRLEQSLNILEKFQFPGIIDELHAMGIRFHDFHAGNIMKRGSTFVMIDLGFSDVQGGKEPPVLERMVQEATLRLLGESRADQVGVTIGRFQPFHRGHADLVRELCRKFNRVILIVGGLKKDERNPFSFKLRERMIKESLPDCISKVEIHEAKFQGKNSGFVPGILSQIIDKNDSTLKADTAVQILVGNDRTQDMKGQLARAQAMRQRGESLSFDPTMGEVTTIPDVEEDGGRISGTAIRQALANDDRNTVEKMVDPHLVSNPDEFFELYNEMREELGVGGTRMKESIDQAGGARNIEETLDANADKLNARRPFPIRWPLRSVGHGKDGYAYDMGGGKIFKATTDKGEAESSLSIQGQNLQHVVRVFDVFRFPPSKDTTGSRVPLYGIVTDKLQDLSSGEKAELEEALGWIMDSRLKGTVRARFMTGDWEGTKKLIQQAMIRFNMGQLGEAADEPTAAYRIPNSSSKTAPSGPMKPPAGKPKKNYNQAKAESDLEFTSTIAVLEKYMLPQMAKELASKGIRFFDYHVGNIMKRGSTYVINDLGRSASKGGEPPMLERMIEQIIEDFAGPGNTAVGAKAGRSAWSASLNQVDPDTEELWQNQLKPLNVQIGHTALPEEKEDAEEG